MQPSSIVAEPLRRTETTTEISSAEAGILATLGRCLFGLGMAGFGTQALWTGQLGRLAPGVPPWIAPGNLWIGAVLATAGIAILANRRVRLAAAVVAFL